jgi:hypothetical protein
VTRNDDDDDDDDDNNNNNNNNNNVLMGWGEGVILTQPRGTDANTEPLYARDSPCVMKSRMLHGTARLTS